MSASIVGDQLFPREEREGRVAAGLELGGGKSDRTAMVELIFFTKEQKIFLHSLQGGIGASDSRTADAVLIKKLTESPARKIAVNAPMTFPPYVHAPEAELVPMEQSKDASVQWMLREAKRAGIEKRKFPTPYTQRAVDLYLRTRVQPKFQFDLHFEEAMGSGRAPLATRMRYIGSQIHNKHWLEVEPRLTLFRLAEWFQIPERELRRYRDIEDGASYRLSILEYLQYDLRENGFPQLFLYDTDMETIAKELPLFNAILSAMMPVYQECNLLESPEIDFDPQWGFVAIPFAR